MKGFTLIHLIVALGILIILMAIPSIFYNDYIARAKISKILSGIGSEKIKLVEEIKKEKKVTPNHRIILDTNHIVDNSMLILSPIIVNDRIYWGCTRIGLSDSQVPQFCRMNDFTSSPINLDSEVNCTLSQGISYNEITTKFSVNVKINDEITVLGNFDNMNEAASSYLDYLNV
jgi:type IV pilus assembly protein PilA